MNILQMIETAEVEWKALGEVVQLQRGKIITAKSASVGNIPVISGGQKPAYFTGEYNRDGETITIAGSGAYAGFVMYWNEPIFVGDAFSVKPNENLLLTKYVYYFLLSNQTKIFGMKKGSGVPHVYPKDVANLIIPIPSLSLQKEIVKILDKMTELEATLEATLEAELALRTKQYRYYRDLLLDCENPQNPFSGSLKVEWKTLGEVCHNIFSGKNKERCIDGLYPIYGSTGIIGRSNNFMFEEDRILVARVGANAGFVHIAIGKYDVSDNTLIVENMNNIYMRYLYYYLESMNLNKFAKGAGQPLITGGQLKALKIPVPPLEAQVKIVEILDKFNALAHSITEGLPREIALRRKQYEYYRELLLNFQIA